MPIGGAELVAAAVVVERQLQLLLLAGDTEEVVGRLLLALADDVHLAAELEPERLVKRPAPLGIGDSVHGVEIARHRRESYAELSRNRCARARRAD